MSIIREWLMETAMKEWSRSVHVTLLSVQGMTVTAGVGALLELERTGLSSYRIDVIMTGVHADNDSREMLKRFATGEEEYEHLLLDIQS